MTRDNPLFSFDHREAVKMQRRADELTFEGRGLLAEALRLQQQAFDRSQRTMEKPQ